MRSDAKTVDQYLAELPEDRRRAISTLREVILKSLPTGYEEGMAYGMIGYHVPHSVYPAGYASQANPSSRLLPIWRASIRARRISGFSRRGKSRPVEKASTARRACPRPWG